MEGGAKTEIDIHSEIEAVLITNGIEGMLLREWLETQQKELLLDSL